MSFEFSPEALLSEIDFQIEKLKLKIPPLDEEFKKTFEIPASTQQNLKRQVIQRKIDAIQNEITEFLDRKRVLEFEKEVRNRENITQFPEPIPIEQPHIITIPDEVIQQLRPDPAVQQTQKSLLDAIQDLINKPQSTPPPQPEIIIQQPQKQDNNLLKIAAIGAAIGGVILIGK